MTADPLTSDESFARAVRSPLGLPIPLHRTLGISIVDVTPGELVARLPASDHLRGADGALVPGSLAVLADVCCGAVVATGLPAGIAAMTAQLRVEFVKAIPVGVSCLEGRSRLDSVDENGGLARAELVDDHDELLAVASLRSLTSANRRITPAVSAVEAVGELPWHEGPVGALLGRLNSWSGNGRADWSVEPQAPATNSFNDLHGGIVALLAHTVATDAQLSVLMPGEKLVPLDLALNYYRGVPAGNGPASASAEVTHRGRRFLVADGQILRSDGRRAVRFSVGAQIRSD
jgi:uncharacterized protein (TIGR00369 family)